MNTRWNLAFCRLGVFRLQISHSRETPCEHHLGPHRTGTGVSSPLGPCLHRSSSASSSSRARLSLLPLASSLCIFTPSPSPCWVLRFGRALGAGAAQTCGVRAVFILPIAARLGLGLGGGGSVSPAAPLAGRSLRAARGRWWWWWVPPTPGLGTPRPSFPAFPMPGSFSHWMAALEQRNISGRPCGRGDLPPERLFSLVIQLLGGLCLG